MSDVTVNVDDIVDPVAAGRFARERAELRDRFAMAALTGLCASRLFRDDQTFENAQIAYEAADAMLAERDRKP